MTEYNLAVLGIHHARGTFLDFSGVYFAEGPWSPEGYRSYAKASRRSRRRAMDYCVMRPGRVSQGPYNQVAPRAAGQENGLESEPVEALPPMQPLETPRAPGTRSGQVSLTLVGTHLAVDRSAFRSVSRLQSEKVKTGIRSTTNHCFALSGLGLSFIRLPRAASTTNVVLLCPGLICFGPLGPGTTHEGTPSTTGTSLSTKSVYHGRGCPSYWEMSFCRTPGPGQRTFSGRSLDEQSRRSYF